MMGKLKSIICICGNRLKLVITVPGKHNVPLDFMLNFIFLLVNK